jgi:hypothetical protein
MTQESRTFSSEDMFEIFKNVFSSLVVFEVPLAEYRKKTIEILERTIEDAALDQSIREGLIKIKNQVYSTLNIQSAKDSKKEALFSLVLGFSIGLVSFSHGQSKDAQLLIESAAQNFLFGYAIAHVDIFQEAIELITALKAYQNELSKYLKDSDRNISLVTTGTRLALKYEEPLKYSTGATTSNVNITPLFSGAEMANKIINVIIPKDNNVHIEIDDVVYAFEV